MSDYPQSEPQTEPLDRLLLQWGDQQNEADRVERLQARILFEAVTSAARPANENPLATQSVAIERTRRGQWAGRLAVTVSLGILILIAGTLWMTPQGHLTPLAARNELPVDARFRPSELEARSQLLNEMNQLFDSQLKWVVETDKQVAFEIAETGAPAASADSACFVVRLIVERRLSDRDSWHRTAALDVLSHNEEFISVPAIENGLACSFWAYGMPDGTVLIESEFQMPDDDSPVAAHPAVLKPGEPSEILTGNSQGQRFRILQTIAVLKTRMESI